MRFLGAMVLGALIFGALALIVGLPLALSHRDELPLERAYGGLAVGVVSRVLGGDATNPRASDPSAPTAGRAAYTGSCAVCHGANGDGRGRFGPATYPDASDLTAAAAKGRTDAQLFWITKNGLGFTAMPSFADAYKDEEIWAIVTYVRALQRGAGRAMEVPAPTAAQLAGANPAGDRVARGAAIFFAQGCYLCHGGSGDAPGELSLIGRIQTEIVRTGDPDGMPAFGRDRISDEELRDLEAYLLRFAAIPSNPD